MNLDEIDENVLILHYIKRIETQQKAFYVEIKGKIDSMVGQFDNKMFTPTQVASLMSFREGKPISVYAVRNWIKKGKLETCDIGKVAYISGRNVKDFCSQNKKKYKLK